MYIEINDKYRINFDGSNYMPEFFSEGGEEITFGKAKGQTTQSKWKNSGKYFSSLPLAVNHIAIQDVQSGKESISLKDFISEYGRIRDEIMEMVGLSDGDSKE